MKKLKLYVGCSLSKASKEFVDSVERLKTALAEDGFEVLDFLGLTKGTPKDVYEWDIVRNVRTCDVFIAICDEPSTGLGYELCEAVRVKKPVLAVAHQDTFVTRLVIGASEAEPNLTFARYTDIVTDVPKLLKEIIKPPVEAK